MTSLTFTEHALPYCVFSRGTDRPRVGAGFGTYLIDLHRMFGDPIFAGPSLNAFMSRGPRAWQRTRERLLGAARSGQIGELVPIAEATLHLPFEVADFADFYSSLEHATNAARVLRPGDPQLARNWREMPVGYHGRAGTVVVSGTDIVRPSGQRKGPDDPAPVFGPSVRLDIEAELGFVVGVGSPLGTAIATGAFADHVFGVVLVNDWSARDLQAWEYVPLGPHLGKSFATSVSAWVVPLAALAAARVPLPGQHPAVLPYLRETQDWGLDIDLAVAWNGEVITRPPYRTMYWSPAQMLAHLTVNGASARTGDLFASGTISGPDRDQRGAFIELTWGGAEPVTVRGDQRTFLQDGDTVTITATAPGAAGRRVGFGEVTGVIRPARP